MVKRFGPYQMKSCAVKNYDRIQKKHIVLGIEIVYEESGSFAWFINAVEKQNYEEYIKGTSNEILN